LDGDRIANVEDNGARLPSSFQHTVDLSGYQGHQTILARWNVADTANAFYACVDVDINSWADPLRTAPRSSCPDRGALLCGGWHGHFCCAYFPKPCTRILVLTAMPCRRSTGLGEAPTTSRPQGYGQTDLKGRTGSFRSFRIELRPRFSDRPENYLLRVFPVRSAHAVAKPTRPAVRARQAVTDGHHPERSTAARRRS